MVKKDIACKTCGYVSDDPIEVCPACNNKKFTTFWQGYVIIMDVEKSLVAKILGITKPGKFALRIG
jgi:DNA-directed RNA polymerase subunit E"